VANDVVLGAKQFSFGITGKLDEDAIAVRDPAFDVGFGDDEIVLAHLTLRTGRCDGILHGRGLRALVDAQRRLMTWLLSDANEKTRGCGTSEKSNLLN
jgi:hypothetical protein